MLIQSGKSIEHMQVVIQCCQVLNVFNFVIIFLRLDVRNKAMLNGSHYGHLALLGTHVGLIGNTLVFMADILR